MRAQTQWTGGKGLRSVTLALLLAAGLGACGSARALTLNVVDGNGNAITNGFRWMLEEDNTTLTVPGAPTNNSISLVIHQSHAPVVATGSSGVNPAAIDATNAMRYVVSVMADGYAVGGANVAAGQTNVTVVLNQHPIPTAQISVLVFNDNNSINNAPDATEAGLPGFQIVLADVAGGPIMQDAFGNPLGTTYATDSLGDFLTDTNGDYVVEEMGDGNIFTDANGEALIKYLAMGKYGVQAISPTGSDWTGGHGSAHVNGAWHQTSTIEGTLTVDAWVTANEPAVFLEGFGPGFYHVFFGFVDPLQTVWAVDPPPPDSDNVTVTGRNVFNHFGRPPNNQMFALGPPVGEAWVGLNEMGALNAAGRGLYVAPCEADGSFQIANVPPGTYQLVTWDKPLDALFGFNTITVTNSPAGTNDLGNVLSYRWFGTFKGSVFHDADEDGFRDPDEEGIPSQAINLRFRDGTVYMATVTDGVGDYQMAEVFPFFKWLVAEVDFARFKASGMTAVVDEGGVIPPDNGWDMPSEGVRNPQPQFETDPVTGEVLRDIGGDPIPIIDPNTGNNLSRTETGPVLTQAMHLFLNQNNRVDWGKVSYPAGENGGISGIAFYSTTRAEEDPREAVGDGWEPGIPRVQVALYQDADADKVIDDLDSNAGVTLADVDNHPLGWSGSSALQGPEDVDGNTNGVFDPGDAIQIVWTDSWDDSPPTGSVQTNPPVVLGKAIIGSDNYSTWNQIRPGVFDGGYAFTSYVPGGLANSTNEVEGLPSGTYIVHAVPPPGYLIQTEESVNVVFGDAYQPSKLWLPPECVGTTNNGAPLHIVPDYLTLFPDQQVPAPFAGEARPLADRKWVNVAEGRNAAADFHMYTEVPKATRVVGFVLNDLTAEFNAFSPIFGEKGSPGWLPISIRDWAGHEVAHVYCDEYGTYNALVPSTYTVNVPSPSGVAPNMLTIVLNDPTMADPTDPTGQRRIQDPHYNPNFSTTPWTLHYYPGSLLYADTPIVPVAGFVGYPNKQLDVEPPDLTPVIESVTNTTAGIAGPYVTSTSQVITITAMGLTSVPNPDLLFGAANVVVRDYGFGAATGSVDLDGTELVIVSWSDTAIQVTLPPSVLPGTAGRLMVTRGDNGRTTPIGITLTYGTGMAGVHQVVPRAATTMDPLPDPIQEAIDAAAPGDLVLVAPGFYSENPILYKPVLVQGSGAGTVVYANPIPAARVTAWHAKVASVLGADPFGASENSGFTVFGTNASDFAAAPSRIDGFTIEGSVSGGGIQVYTLAHNLRISNNRIHGNQGTFCGGISLGMLDNIGTVYDNTNVTVTGNQIVKNGGINGAGGVAVYTGGDGYRIVGNEILGNFCRGNGGGVGQQGVSDGGLIADNIIRNNEVFYALSVGGDGGGIFIGGATVAGGIGSGSGSVTIRNNLIQGNLAGSGKGGGVCVNGANGADVQASGDPSNWYAVDLFNNLIVNNVAGWSGGGISLQDVTRVRIIHNTVAHNDSTATSKSAFGAGAVDSTPQGAGIVAHQHGALLAAVSGQVFCDPDLRDNILWHNRSFFYDGANQVLLPDPLTPFRDIEVAGGSFTLNPLFCVLTDATGYDSSNLAADPMFADGYSNTLYVAAVIDEAGNNISVRFEPTGPQGDYHLAAGSPAIDAAATGDIALAAALRSDVDKEYRPYGAGSDIGADEVSVLTVTAVADRYGVEEDGLLVVPVSGVLTNDTGPGGPLSALLETGPSHGTLILYGDGSFAYEPAADFNGADAFSYRASVGADVSLPAQVGILVTPANDAPVAEDDFYTVNGNGSLTVPAPGVLANDTDLDGDPLSAVHLIGPDDGVLSLNADGSFTYTPDPGFEGVDTFFYQAEDGASGVSIAAVEIDVTAVLPDFVVTEISLTPQVATNGGMFTAYLKVRNQGTGAGTGGRLSVWVDQPGADVPPGTPEDAYVDVGPIPAGVSTSLTVAALSAPAIPTPEANQYAPTFRAFINSADTEPEFDAGNNQLTQDYLVVRYSGTPPVQGGVTNGALVAQDMVTLWNLIALEMVKTNVQMAPVASRSLAMMHAAVYDSVNAVDMTYSPYRVNARPGYACSREAAAASAAYTVLSTLYTGQVAYLDVALSNSLATVADGPAKTNGIALGADIGAQMAAWREDDHMMMAYTPGTNAGDWRPTPPAYMPAMMPGWSMATPFAMMDSMQFRPPPPPELDSPEYTAAFLEVKAVGAAASATRTLAQTQAVMFWTDMPGTVTTAGRWNQIARDVALQQTNSLSENARLFALLNIGLADAGIMAWDSKYFYNRWRPVTAIREAATDGNPETDPDPVWTPMVVTPAFPEYIAAHSAFSAAAAGVLSSFFGRDDIVFAASAYMNPASRRFYGSFSSAANEAGNERVWGGVHFSYGNEGGLAAGYALGGYVAANFLVPSLYPPDTDGLDTDGDGNSSNDVAYINLAASDGFSKMADGNELYTFGFSDHTLTALAHAGTGHDHITPPMVMMEGMLKAEASGPTIVLKEGQRFYIDLSNVGMVMRPDLFDPHTVHFHGFPNAAPIFDGEPMGSISVNMGSTLRYYYEIVEPGTFIYHCHVEATEHMEMGMIGNLYVMPRQNNLPDGTPLGSFIHQAGYRYAYNDGDGSTRYDVEYPLQLTGFDRNFHEQHIAVQPLPFWSLHESYPMINGRGYPDTVDPNPIYNASADNASQKVSSLITATQGQKILLRISNVSISDFHTLTVLGIPMQVVGKDARLLRSTSGVNLYYRTTSVTLGGGETADVILDTAGVAPGTYFVYDARLNHLSNDREDFGGMMTEIRIE